MSPRRYRVEQFALAFVLAAGGIAVGVGLIVKALWDSIDEAVALPRLPGHQVIVPPTVPDAWVEMEGQR